jgi:hypothetical protein
VIAPAIAKDIGAAENDLRPQVVAASLTAAFNVLADRGGGASARGGLDALKAPRASRRR